MEAAPAWLPHLTGLRVERVLLTGTRVRVDATTTGTPGTCAGCGSASARVHSRYRRRLADTGIGGHEVVLLLTVRRFFCDQASCAKQTFAEQIPGLTIRYGRTTAPARQVVSAVAMALGGRAGARLAGRLSVPVSRTTLLRMIRRRPDPPVAAA
jgi:transposase